MTARLMCGPSPWHSVRYQGFDWMVRVNAGAIWIVRLPDRATWLLDAMPDWAAPARVGQLELI